MPDTMRGDLKGTPCSDCGQSDQTEYKHWGPLVPSGTTGYFCQDCFNIRNKDRAEGREPRTLEVQPINSP
jgi:hypothetical protein